MSDTMTALLGSIKPKPTIPDKVPLICLVLYLFHDYENEESRVKELNDLFYKYHDAGYMQQITDALHSDKEADGCYQAATEAIQNGLIEILDWDYDSDWRDDKKLQKVYTVSFLEWAEQAGYALPEYVMPDNKKQIEMYYHQKTWREEKRRNFPKINRSEFEQLLNEPLWSMTDAILYVLGFKSKKSQEDKVGFLKYKDMVEKIQGYVEDAQKTGDLKLYDYDNEVVVAPDVTDNEDSKQTAFWGCKIKPRDFLSWLQGLPLDLPVLQTSVQETVAVHMKSGTDSAQKLANKDLPKIDFESLLHPEIERVSMPHYHDKDYRHAVLDAVTAIFDKLRERTGEDLDGAKLATKVFSPASPLLVISTMESESGRNEQSGFMDMIKGIYSGVRNPKAHSLLSDLNETTAAQYLVTASLLMRRVCDASEPNSISGNS